MRNDIECIIGREPCVTWNVLLGFLSAKDFSGLSVLCNYVPQVEGSTVGRRSSNGLAVLYPG